MIKKISGVYKITNTITKDFYIGSSKDVKRRWANHKCLYTWKKCPNNPMYLDMQKYGTNKFELQILAEVESDSLKEVEQQFIETLKPTYNNIRAKGLDVERKKEYIKKYQKSNKYKEYQKDYNQNNEKRKEYIKKYQKSNKYKEYQKDYNQNNEKRKEYIKKYDNQLCSYNGETLTLCALAWRFRKAGIEHPKIEAKKYILTNCKVK